MLRTSACAIPTRIRRFLAALILCLALPAQLVFAQSEPDIVRGRVTDDSSRAIAGAAVIVTRGPDRLVQHDTTDSTGSFSLKFDPGTGDYLVFISATGYSSVRRRVQRAGTEHELIANFILKPDLTKLAAINVKASKPTRARLDIGPYNPETGSSEKWQDGVNGQVPPSTAGDLNSVAGTMSNVTMVGGTPSILGSGASSNLTTLNGMGMAAGSIPRAANTQTRVTGATFDPTRGGFSGANIDVQLGPGDRFYQQRRGFLTLAPAGLQFTDAIGRSNGAQTGNFRGSLGADGELIRDELTYNVAVDLSRSANQPPNLLDADNGVLLRAGVAPDSVSRLLAVAPSIGLGLSRNGIPSAQEHNAFSWLTRFDITSDTLATRALTTYATFAKDGGAAVGPLTAPSASGEQTQRTLGAQLTLGNYVGAGRRILTETRLSASASRNQLTPYENLPGASVLVLSPTLNGSADAGNLTLGGGQFANNDSHWTLEGSNLTMWNTSGMRNQFRATIWARADGLHQSAISNEFGNYSFNSLNDLANGNADSYSRTLSQPARTGTVWNAATAVAHQ
ncbi:MAG: carboxypeptidase-like regulatory domain-containing protein, partial [Gemmatimonadaceae bacterium]